MSKVKYRRISTPGGGSPCPKCGLVMERRRWLPGEYPKNRDYYFHFWDVCKPCHHIQFDNKNKVFHNADTPQTQNLSPQLSMF
jgi:hypothetical protein